LFVALSVFHAFRYHITASGCELAKKLVQANAMSDGADYPVETRHKQQTDRAKKKEPVTSECRLPDYELPVDPAAGVSVDDFAVMLDEDNEWENELGFVLPEQTHSRQSW